MVVDDADEGIMLVLEADPVSDGAHVVADVDGAGGLDAAEHPRPTRRLNALRRRVLEFETRHGRLLRILAERAQHANGCERELGNAKGPWRRRPRSVRISQS